MRSKPWPKLHRQVIGSNHNVMATRIAKASKPSGTADQRRAVGDMQRRVADPSESGCLQRREVAGREAVVLALLFHHHAEALADRALLLWVAGRR
jgi:hypothetical protein